MAQWLDRSISCIVCSEGSGDIDDVQDGSKIVGGDLILAWVGVGDHCVLWFLQMYFVFHDEWHGRLH